MAFRVDLAIFRGPLDLLLYLVRKHELEIVDIPVALVTKQFLDHLAVLEVLDVNSVGDFLEMASTLVEIKSRMVLPHADEVEEALEDPRQELVRQLLEYKKFKDAASMLEERGRAWQERYPRLSSDLPVRERSLADEPIHEVELWDLVSAFGRIMRQHEDAAHSNSIVYDDTPIHVFMGRIRDQLVARGRLALGELFQPGMHKSTLVGIFLAILELVRHHTVEAQQDHLFGEVWLQPGAEPAAAIDAQSTDNYEHGRRETDAK
ncbi:MAG TPA: segregation/condensation protein A [Pirellulales bacterium]|jgi:segregation and condensation protein A|nr:segregation/condensation protein A [Pirellulales bacterium]